ncbi:MAG: hypothetical protein ACYS9X_27985 [Planctomycetota bacterium]
MSIDRLKGYGLDPASKRRWQWRPSTFVLGAMLLGGAGVVLYYGFVAKEAEGRGTVMVGGLAAAMVAVFLMAYLQRKARCAGCGRWMTPMYLDVPASERGLLDRLRDSGRDPDALYTTATRAAGGHASSPHRLMTKLFVCHGCRTFFVALRRDPRKVEGGREGVERQREFRRRKRRLKEDGVFDEVRKKRRGRGRAR